MNTDVSVCSWRVPLLAVPLMCALSSAALAQSVPSPWTARDIGAPRLSGSATYSSGVFTVDAAGTDIGGSSDQFHFVYQAVSGDVEISARVDSLDDVYSWTNAGVMIRASLSATSAHGYTASTSENGVYFRRRLTDGVTATAVAGQKIAAPVWVRLVRQGTLVTSYSSTNGTNWTTIGASTVPLGATAYVGLAVTSRKVNMRATAVFSNVRVTSLGSTPPPAPPPAGYQNQDIGAPAIKGSVTVSSNVYTVTAGGADIWGTSDEFHFLYQPVTGNVEVLARVASITNTDAWAKAGVMIRESLTAQSRHAMTVATIASGYSFQRRPDTGSSSVSTTVTGTAPGWVRLVRTGDLFESYRSSNGTTWTKIGSDTIPMNDTVYVGIAVTSHNVATATTAVLDSLQITASTATTTQPPAVSITAPVNGTQVTAPATVTIAATATDPEGRMMSVDFYAGSTLLGRDTTAPYSFAWSATTAGSYPLTAVAHDADGGSSTSGAVNVTVATAPNNPPTVSLSSPAAGATFTAPATITLSATASDPENQLARVEFFAGTTKVATVTTAPYSFSWTNVAAGSYSITAVAYDTAGASATSAARSITVTGTTTTPPRYVVFTASTDHSSNVTSYMLKVFAAGANPATATPLATSDLGKPTPASNGDITVDRGTLFTALGAGSYLGTVTAIGPGGQTPSSSVSFTR